MMDELQRQAEQFRASGLLGKSGALSRLFDFLLSRSLVGEVPKEIEIALQVFGKGANFDVAQDSVVRVYVHKLRRRLEEFAVRSLTATDSRPVLNSGKPVRVSLLSALDPNVLKSTHVVYVGYISGMGMLGDRVFAQSRLALGGSFDELNARLLFVSAMKNDAIWSGAP